jgi:hypothetical protein
MAKKAPKQLTHIRIRLEPKLLAQLEKSRETHGRTLTGEIVVRLEESFDNEKRSALVKEVIEKLVGQFSQQMIAVQAAIVEALRQGRASEESAKEILDLRAHLREFESLAHLLNVILGDNKRKSDFLRAVALELVDLPDDSVPDLSGGEFADRVVARLSKQQGAAS